MKLNEEVQVPAEAPTWLSKFLFANFRAIGRKVNGLSSGTFYAIDGQATAAPTTGAWGKGDFLRNTAPTEAGAGGSKYLVFGWVCETAGTPGTWCECRFLTGA
jgi:hypothetical protein